MSMQWTDEEIATMQRMARKPLTFNRIKTTPLERAQAIAAEVRARKFPAPRRITPLEEK